MIALIPARGGSKGLPGKNVRPLAGKPLIAYAIEAARESVSIDRVIVSTDDEAIARVAVGFGAEVPFLRPAELATDTAMAIDSYIYTVNRLEREGKVRIPDFAVLLPTTPLRTAADVDGAIRLFREKQADSVVSYTPEAHPVRWHRYLDGENRIENAPDQTIANRQDLRTSYYPNGAVYVFRTDVIRARTYYTDRSYAYVMPRCRSVDIDSLEDWRYAEFLLAEGSALT